MCLIILGKIDNSVGELENVSKENWGNKKK